jgi:hypothetical protein
MGLTLHSGMEIMAERMLLLLRWLVMAVGMPMSVVGMGLCLLACMVEMLVRHNTMHQYQRIGEKGKEQQRDIPGHYPKLVIISRCARYATG